MIPTPATARFLRAYLAGGNGPVREEELRVEVGGQEREATLFLPAAAARPIPGWVVLHGMTTTGRRHLAMTRFVRSLAASGAAVLVPDVPSWRTLRVDTTAAAETLEGSARFLASRPEVRGGSVAAAGFSFGATQALIAAAAPSVRDRIRGVVSFGAYCELRSMVRCLFTGEHEWRGRRFTLDPDPYGRWIMVGNFLSRVPGFEGMEEVERAALRLALESGRHGAFAWEPVYDPWKAEARRGLALAAREVWDVVAPPAGTPPRDAALARALADGLAETIRRTAPGLDPAGRVEGLAGRVVLSHGRADRLIPWTETLRLREILPPDAPASVTITGLFAHSAHAGWMHPLARAREAGGFVRLLNRALAVAR
jgi:pimeloyl-ACP methyl ester carboxylesterase